MEILEKPNGRKEGCASLANIGYDRFDISLDGELYKYGLLNKPIHCEEERVGSNKWKIYTCDVSGNLIERVIRTDVLVGCAWYNIDESLWENSIYVDTIRRCKEFFSISNSDKAKTIYKTSRGFYYYVTRFGDVWNTETMTKVNGRVSVKGYRHAELGSGHDVRIHRLVAHHFVPKPKDLVDQRIPEENLVVNHLDGNKLNNNWNNLEWTTNAGNLAHASATGLMHTTIDDHLLEHVFKRLQEGWPDIDISKETGISDRVVSHIRQGKSRRYRTDKYTWPKHSPNARELDEDTILSIYNDFMYTDMNNSEIGRKYNISDKTISALRLGKRRAKLACEYITSKGLDRYWKGYRPPK